MKEQKFEEEDYIIIGKTISGIGEIFVTAFVSASMLFVMFTMVFVHYDWSIRVLPTGIAKQLDAFQESTINPEGDSNGKEKEE